MTTPQQSQVGGNPWRDAINEACVSAGLDALADDANPTKVLRRLIDWSCVMVLDPAISERAQNLVDQGAARHAQAAAPQAAEAATCGTCHDTGMIGGPSFYAPDEGGVLCPDCAPPPSAPTQAAAPGVQGWPKPAPLTLTGHQIAELAKFAGDDPEAEVSVQHRSAFTSDEGEKMPSGLYCWATDYPEEGCIPLERLPDCSMNPSSCPRNEGHGCDCGMGASLPSQEGQHG